MQNKQTCFVLVDLLFIVIEEFLDFNPVPNSFEFELVTSVRFVFEEMDDEFDWIIIEFEDETDRNALLNGRLIVSRK